MPGEGGARFQGVISGCHGSVRPRGNFPAPPAGCPRWKRLPWTGARPGARLAGRLGRVGGWPVHPGLLRCARLSFRLQGPGRAVLTHLHPGLFHEQLHDLPYGLHLRPFPDHCGPPHCHVGPRGPGAGPGKRTLGSGVLCREPRARQLGAFFPAALPGTCPGVGTLSRPSLFPEPLLPFPLLLPLLHVKLGHRSY